MFSHHFLNVAKLQINILYSLRAALKDATPNAKLFAFRFRANGKLHLLRFLIILKKNPFLQI